MDGLNNLPAVTRKERGEDRLFPCTVRLPGQQSTLAIVPTVQARSDVSLCFFLCFVLHRMKPSTRKYRHALEILQVRFQTAIK